MGFIRVQQERLVRRLIVRRCQKLGRPIPEGEALDREATRVREEAARIASRRGRNVLSILADLVDDLRR